MSWLALKLFFGGVWKFLSSLPPWVYAAIAVAVLWGASMFWAYGHGKDSQKAATEAVKTEYGQFVAETKRQGLEATKKAREQELADKQRKELADAENAKTVATLRADNQRLLNSRTTRGYLPPAAPSSGSPATACFSRADLESAIRQLDAGVSRLIGEGDQGIAGLDTAKRWAQ
jgi:hypothetical protein